MTTAGIYADIYEPGRVTLPVIAIGDGVPRLHHSDGSPVYLIVEHEQGADILCRDGRHRRLLAYPSSWPAPGHRSDRILLARHERLRWDAPIPCFDLELDL